MKSIDSLRDTVYAYYALERANPGRDALDATDKLQACMLRAQSIALDPMRLEIGIVRLRRIVDIWTKLESADERDGAGFRASCEVALSDAMDDAAEAYGDIWQ